MEAEVYAYGPYDVLKLYHGTAGLADLLTLQAFYDGLDRQSVPYALPQIHAVAREGPLLITIEKRLPGTRMSEALPALTVAQLDEMMQRYLTAALALSRIQAPSRFERYKLFDPEQISQRTDGDWHGFLRRFMAHKRAQVTPYLRRDVSRFADKMQQLDEVLDIPYQGDYRLVHGDFFPGNLLIDVRHQITALLDFGLLTMYGDPLFDLATGWVFFDMYDELHVNARDRYLAMLLERLGKGVRGKLYRYVLVYSILSANTYSPTCADGHYRWCVDNLNQTHYWKAMD
jgi:Ser/Thr protein kinase RdoA (MazF antagonist)